MDQQITLKTFQPLARIAELRFDGALLGRWESVTRGWEGSYRQMVAAMARHGIDCAGRPPVWAWAGHVTWGDAFGLLDEDSELRLGYATITFRAPTDLVLLSEYDPWCDALGSGEWSGAEAWSAGEVPRPEADAPRILQAALPRIEASWVAAVEPLPTSGIYELDWDTPV